MSRFTIDAGTIFQIGRESIENVTLAVSEVIKNSYDADASYCHIIVEKNKVIIYDDGIGMSYENLQNNWLRIGTDNKIKNPFTKKGRRKIGEKGIGRFALNRIGNIIEIYTKTGSESSYLKINFNKFIKGQDLQDIPVELGYFNNNDIDDSYRDLLVSHGTLIVISDLYEEWDEKLIEKIQLECSKLSSLNKHYLMVDDNKLIFNKEEIADIRKRNNEDNFEIKLFDKKHSKNDDNDIISKLDEYLKYSLFRMKVNVDTRTMEYHYTFSFHPYEGLGVMDKDKNVQRGIDIIMDVNKRGRVPLINKDINLGKIEMELFAYDFSALVNRYSPFKKITPLKQVVKENGGIKVYRDGQRVYNYGEPGFDWLELDAKRVNRPGRFLSNNVLVGNVYLSRNDTIPLEEKTNREGFIVNKEYNYFKKIVQYIIFEFSSKVEGIKFLIKKNLGDPKIIINYDETIETLNQKINSIDSIRKEDKKELQDGLYLVKEQLNYIKNVMLNISIEAMDYFTIIHDIEKRIERMTKLVKAYSNDELIELVNDTYNIIVKQNNILRDKSRKDYILNELLSEIVYSSRYKFITEDINIIEDYSETKGEYIKINKSSLIRILDNIFNNSVYWKSGKDDTIKIYTKNHHNSIEVIIDDSGCGFRGNVDFLKEPFVTTKINDDGIGLGLFIVEELMKGQNGYLVISNNSSIKKGSAQVKLIFPKEL